jgi:hypothetical protein
MAYPPVNYIPAKDPLDVLPYAFDWTNFLAAGETIQAATITVPDGIVVSLQQIVGNVVQFFLSGGTDGQAYKIDCFIQTNSTPAANRSFLLQVANQ